MDVNTNGGGNKKVVDPIEDFVEMENELAIDLCNFIDNSLSSLKKVLFGSGLLTPTIQSMAMSLLSTTVPMDWQKRWDRGPDKPLSWLRELIRKRVSLMQWRTRAHQGNLLGQALTLGDLFHPATFLNALRQQSARQLNRAIDQVKLACTWSTADTSMGKNSSSSSSASSQSQDLKRLSPVVCTLNGLLLQGAGFVNSLQEAAPEANEIVPAPPVHIGFVPKDASWATSEEAQDDNNPLLSIPVYLTPTREDFLVELDMKVGRASPSQWILSGVALFLSEEV